MNAYNADVIAGMAMGDEAQSIDIFEELCDICRRQGLLQDAPSGLFHTGQQQLSDLAELMHSYGFPTPGWGAEEEDDQDGTADMAVDEVAIHPVHPDLEAMAVVFYAL